METGRNLFDHGACNLQFVDTCHPGYAITLSDFGLAFSLNVRLPWNQLQLEFLRMSLQWAFFDYCQTPTLQSLMHGDY